MHNLTGALVIGLQSVELNLGSSRSVAEQTPAWPRCISE